MGCHLVQSLFSTLPLRTPPKEGPHPWFPGASGPDGLPQLQVPFSHRRKTGPWSHVQLCDFREGTLPLAYLRDGGSHQACDCTAPRSAGREGSLAGNCLSCSCSPSDSDPMCGSRLEASESGRASSLGLNMRPRPVRLCPGSSRGL